MTSGAQWRELNYKIPPYKYAKHFKLDTVLESQHVYKLVTGEGDVDGYIQDSSVFGELKARDHKDKSQNKYFTKQVVHKPRAYNPYHPYAKSDNSNDAYRPVNYRPFFGEAAAKAADQIERGEVPSGDADEDFFNLSGVKPQAQPNNPLGFQAYEPHVDIPDRQISTDEVPGPSGFFDTRSHDQDDEDSDGDADGGDYAQDFYQQLETLAKQRVNPNMPFAGALAMSSEESVKRNSNKDKREQLQLPEQEPERWNHGSHKFQARLSSLSTYKCWKCKRVGHFPEDCTAFIGVAAPTPSDPNSLHTPAPPDGAGERTIYTPKLRQMYNRCQKLAQKIGDKCADCGARSNLAQCLDCGVVACDNKGHLMNHLRNNPSHNMMYSYKLRRQVKCCKTTCTQMNVYKLFACSGCLDKCFNRHYSQDMMNATWSAIGVKYIPNSICCDEHFEWHRVNCASARTGYSHHVVEKEHLYDDEYGGQISEHIF